jgi:hypothetical protein
MTNIQEMMNPTEFTKNNAQIMTGLMDRVWEAYDAQCVGFNMFNQKMSDLMEQSIAAVKTQSEPITSKMGMNNYQTYKLIDQMVGQNKAAQESMMNIASPYMKQIKNSMYKAIENSTGGFDLMSNSLFSNPAFKSYMDFAKGAEGFSKMSWMNMGTDSTAKATATDTQVFKNKVS